MVPAGVAGPALAREGLSALPPRAPRRGDVRDCQGPARTMIPRRPSSRGAKFFRLKGSVRLETWVSKKRCSHPVKEKKILNESFSFTRELRNSLS